MMRETDRETYGNATKCICPKCGRKHKVKMRWIGRGVPRKFCPPCKIANDDHDHVVEPRLNIWAAVRHTILMGGK